MDQKERIRSYGQLVIDFANAETPKTAKTGLLRDAQQLFGFTAPSDFYEKPLYTYESDRYQSQRRVSAPTPSEIENIQRDLREGFAAMLDGHPLSKNRFFLPFLFEYPKHCPKHLVFSKDNKDTFSFWYEPILREKFLVYTPLKPIITYCLVEFLKCEENRQLVHSCLYCGKIFISTTLREQKFCPGGKCHSDYHNWKRIKSGEAREYKRRRRAEGRDQ